MSVFFKGSVNAHFSLVCSPPATVILRMYFSDCNSRGESNNFPFCKHSNRHVQQNKLQ